MKKYPTWLYIKLWFPWNLIFSNSFLLCCHLSFLFSFEIKLGMFVHYVSSPWFHGLPDEANLISRLSSFVQTVRHALLSLETTSLLFDVVLLRASLGRFHVVLFVKELQVFLFCFVGILLICRLSYALYWIFSFVFLDKLAFFGIINLDQFLWIRILLHAFLSFHLFEMRFIQLVGNVIQEAIYQSMLLEGSQVHQKKSLFHHLNFHLMQHFTLILKDAIIFHQLYLKDLKQ